MNIRTKPADEATPAPAEVPVALDDLCAGAGTICSARYRSTTPERVLASASWFFCHHGFHATGVDAIARRAGTAKTSLYKHFGNKEQLIEAVLEREGAAWRSWFFSEMAKVEGTAEDQLLAVFDILESWFADPYFFGCPFINALGEFDVNNARLRKILAAHKAHLNGWIAAQAEMIGARDPASTVARFTILIDGAIVAAQASGNPACAGHARDLAALQLAAETQHKTRRAPA
ncbi:MAG: TetR/AcrR family transcriptional regulator [Halochromatium sp.]|uniref:TetR/AcrR family transcriptional regulator n=1 Tax=Halochromatium sp. TaxID=2049430 RepID=UPI0039799603